MREGTYKYIVQTLNDYDEIDKHIKRRVEELTYPVVRHDDNIGGGSGGVISNPTEKIAITILDDKLISSLNHTKLIVTKVLNELEPEARKIIQLYYIDNRKYTWRDVAKQTNYSEKQCRNIKNIVFEKIAKELGMPT